jgi:hypothetical protein
MTTVVIGGHSRNVGKTTIAAGLIRALRDYRWTAIKISSHWHGGGVPSGTERPERAFHIREETDPDGNSDTSRYLAAGAARAFWVRVQANGLAPAVEALRPFLRPDSFVLIESNGILRFLRPDICVVVLRYDMDEFKESAGETLARADAAVALGDGSLSPPWKEAAKAALAHAPVFEAGDPWSIPGDLIEWARARLPHPPSRE